MIAAKLVRYDLQGVAASWSRSRSMTAAAMSVQDRSGASEIEDVLTSPRPATAAVMAEVRCLIDTPLVFVRRVRM
jgi:hypothetical protein